MVWKEKLVCKQNLHVNYALVCSFNPTITIYVFVRILVITVKQIYCFWKYGPL